MVKNEVVCTPVVENEVVAIGTSVMENKGGGTQVPNNVVGNQCVDRRWWVHLCGQHRGGINQGGELGGWYTRVLGMARPRAPSTRIRLPKKIKTKI